MTMTGLAFFAFAGAWVLRRALEDRLGARLLLKAGRGVALTPEGSRLAAALDSAFRTMADRIRRRLHRIAAAPADDCQRLIARLVRLLQEQHRVVLVRGLQNHIDARVAQFQNQ